MALASRRKTGYCASQCDDAKRAWCLPPSAGLAQVLVAYLGSRRPPGAVLVRAALRLDLPRPYRRLLELRPVKPRIRIFHGVSGFHYCGLRWTFPAEGGYSSLGAVGKMTLREAIECYFRTLGADQAEAIRRVVQR